MFKERVYFKGVIVLATCVLVTGALANASTPGGRHPSGFTLAPSVGDSSPFPFTLATPALDPGGLAGPGGLGIIEDSGAPYRTALGFNALFTNNSGHNNTAVGYMALYVHYYGSGNTALGANALQECQEGSGITAIGADALRFAYGGADFSTAIGSGSLGNNRGVRNTAVGARSGPLYDWGQDNTAVGYGTLAKAGRDYPFSSDCNTAIGALALENLTGIAPDYQAGPTRYNTALGYKAGSSVIFGEHNIFIGANQYGMDYDTNTIRIGSPYSTSYPQGGQNRTYIAGIVETPLNPSDGPSVVGITSEGRLGTMSSDMLPQGPQGPQGIPGSQGPPGEGLVPGSLLYMAVGFTPPEGYVPLGMIELGLIDPATKKATRLKVNIFQKL